MLIFIIENICLFIFPSLGEPNLAAHINLWHYLTEDTTNYFFSLKTSSEVGEFFLHFHTFLLHVCVLELGSDMDSMRLLYTSFSSPLSLSLAAFRSTN